MVELEIGQEVEMEFGGKAQVLSVIGSGGQGTVYLVRFNGMKWALKWYDIDKMTVREAINSFGLNTLLKKLRTELSAISWS